MDDLVKRISAAIDEDERVARAATIGPWRVANVADYGSATVDGPDVLQDGGDDGTGTGGRRQVLRPLVVIPQDVDYGPTVELTDAEHIARHDPARVLRRVAVDRKLLELHSSPDPSCDECGYLTPCATVRLLAEAYDVDPGQ